MVGSGRLVLLSAMHTHHRFSNIVRWVGAFNCVSGFGNSGMSLLDVNMIAFNKSVFILLSMSLFILAGNTCFPVFLRFIIWTFYQILPSNDEWSDKRYTLKFLLDHPRRCFTHLFPAEHTWWLLWSVVCLNGIDCIMFMLLNVSSLRSRNAI